MKQVYNLFQNITKMAHKRNHYHESEKSVSIQNKMLEEKSKNASRENIPPNNGKHNVLTWNLNHMTGQKYLFQYITKN